MLVNIYNEELAKRIVENGEGTEMSPIRLYYEQETEFQLDMFRENHYLSDEDICELREELCVFFDDISFEDICSQITDFIAEWYEHNKC